MGTVAAGWGRLGRVAHPVRDAVYRRATTPLGERTTALVSA